MYVIKTGVEQDLEVLFVIPSGVGVVIIKIEERERECSSEYYG
jgi:hypothetical protein